MRRSLWSAAAGMKAQQTNMDVVSHNLANVNTFGNKKVRAEFQDLLYQTLRQAGAESGADSRYPTAHQSEAADFRHPQGIFHQCVPNVLTAIFRGYRVTCVSDVTASADVVGMKNVHTGNFSHVQRR